MRFEQSDFEEKPVAGDNYDRIVILLEPPARKIAVIKAVRNCADIGLKDAKELVERAPTPVLSHVSAAQADQLYRHLIEAGAKVAVESLDRYDDSQLVGVPRNFVLREPAGGCLGVGAGILMLIALCVLVA